MYSKGRKKAVVQLIPKKVWVKAFADYTKEFPSSISKEDSLEDHLRDSLKVMISGVDYNPKDRDALVIHDEDLMKKLMNTESWKAKNVVKLRDDLM